MLFNSCGFILFFLVVYAAYYLLRSRLSAQNSLLLAASYFFYGCWNWQFLSLIMISTVVDFYVGLAMGRDDDPRVRKRWLMVSVVSNLSILGFFKYFGFFAESAVLLLNRLGMDADPVTLNIVLPVGISFYTFQTLSYSIDVYRRRLKPCYNLLDFAVFVAFFPQLVAGPIERAVNLIPQVRAPRKFDINQINAGVFLVLWGYFKKVVIADNIAVVANEVFNHHASFEGLDLIMGVLAFAIQIYCDFSGYSDIARGIAKLMGFELMLNFRLPYFATSPSDFWNRWHVSLSSWLRDYLYISLGGNRRGALVTWRNLFVTMVLGGLWHGAGWNFVLWGVFHGGILVVYRVASGGRPTPDPWTGSYSFIKTPLKMLLMFSLTLYGWLLFRAQSCEQIMYFTTHAGFSASAQTARLFSEVLFFGTPLLVVQVFQYLRCDLLFITRLPAPVVALFYSFLLVAILLFGVRESTEFIYFQF